MTIFRTWAKNLPPFVSLYSVQPPGRGSRIAEAPFTNLLHLADAAAQALRSMLDMPFAFYGHSMGAIVMFEVARRLFKQDGLQPAHLFVSACRAPHLFNNGHATYNLPESEFIEELRRLCGTPKEVLEHTELMRLMIPLLRADFQVCQTYQYLPGPSLSCGLTAFGGLQDDQVSREQLAAWREHTSDSFRLEILPGDHFFLHNNEALLLSLLCQQLYRLVEG